jgi:hypothetical protein
MPSRFLIPWIFALCTCACGDLSPATPTDIEREPVLAVLPTEPLRSNTNVLYFITYSFNNPKAANGSVTVTRVEFSILGGDSSVYGVGEDPTFSFGRARALAPGQSLGNTNTFSDLNTTHAAATACSVRVFFTRSDGSTWKLEEQSALLPPR